MLRKRRTTANLLLPAQECGFVNFVSVADAIRAKEDVLNRLGGQLTKTSGLVRIGYGKGEPIPGLDTLFVY
jgi:protein JSN1